MKLSLPLLLLSLLAAAQVPDDPWKPAELLTPAKFAAELNTAGLKTSDPSRHIVYVGFPVMYKGAHIPKAKMAGPGFKQQGLDRLPEELKGVPLDVELVIYCGCCPFVRCPNIRPAYRALKEMGFTKIKVLQLTTNLHTNWVEKGYPIELSTK